MRLVLVTLSCLASLMAVEATSFVTVVKTIVEDRPVSLGRRDEDDLVGDPSVTKVCITSPATTCLDLTLTEGLKPQDTKSEDSDDEDGWDDYTPPPTTTTKAVEQATPSVITGYTTASSSGPPVRNTGPTVTHSKGPETYTEIPDWWPNSVGPGVDPDIERPKIPEIINPDWVSKPKPEPKEYPYCDIYPRPDSDPSCAETLTSYGRFIARATLAKN